MVFSWVGEMAKYDFLVGEMGVGEMGVGKMGLTHTILSHIITQNVPNWGLWHFCVEIKDYSSIVIESAVSPNLC